MKIRLLVMAIALDLGITHLSADTLRDSYEITWKLDPNYSYPSTAIDDVLKTIESSGLIQNHELNFSLLHPQLDLDDQGNATLSLSAPLGTAPCSIRLADLQDRTDGTTRYVLQGEIQSAMKSGSSYLELQSIFAGSNGGDFVRTAKAESHSEQPPDWKSFELSCAGDPAPNSNTNLSLTLQWSGSGEIHFRHLKLFIYRKTLPLTPIEQNQATKWGLIGGIGGTMVGVIGGLVGVAVTLRRLRKQKREEELRRMAAFDVPTHK